MFGKIDEYISISLSEDTLKVAQFSGTGTATQVTQVAARDVKGIAETDLPNIVSETLKPFKTKSAHILCVIPSGMVTTKNIEVPSTNPEEIKSIVNLQAARHTPFSREEIQIGYVTLGVYKNNFTKVLLVIANRTTLKNQLAIFEKAGLKVRKVLFAPEGIARLYGGALNLEAQLTPVGIIDLGKHSTDFIVVLKDVPITSRNIPIGLSQLAEGPAVQEKLLDELAKTIESYKSEDIDQVPEKYFLSSDDHQTKGLQAILEKRLKWTVEINPYVNHIKASQTTLEQLATQFVDVSFLDVIATAPKGSNPQVNLIPEELQLQKSVEDQGHEVFKAAALVLTIFILVATGLGAKYLFSNSYLTKLVSRYEGSQKEVAMLKNRSLKTNIVQNFLNTRMVSLDVINEFYRNIPNEIYLTGITMDENGNVSVQGISDIASLVFNLGSSLKESKAFKSVEIKSTTAKKDRGKDVSAFEITLKLASAPDDETKAEKVEE